MGSKMQKRKQPIKEIIIVEGKYDKNVVSQIVDTLIVETSGYQIFKDKEKMNLIRRLATARGVIVLTDSDSAGFIIRNHIKGSIPTELIKHAYIPDIYGKERRKTSPSKEGKLGVEGMPPNVILDALKRAGATFIDGSTNVLEGNYRNSKKNSPIQDTSDSCRTINNMDVIELKDFYDAGLTGREGSSGNRRTLLESLDLPARMSTNALLDVVNVLFTKSEFKKYVSDILEIK